MKKTPTILTIIVIFLIASIVFAQYNIIAESGSLDPLPANVIWKKAYGGPSDDRAFYAVTAGGDNYLVVGSSKSIVPNKIVGWALELDTNGNAVWNKTFLDGYGTELRFAINLTDGFLLVGNEFLPTGNINGYVAKIDNQGNLIWQKLIGDNETDEFYSAIATSDGFVLLGSSSLNGGSEPQAWVVKISDNGTVLWNKTYGTALDTVAKSGVLAPDGEYMIAGYTDPRGAGQYDFLLMKIDQEGNLVWNQTYGGTGSQEAHSMTQAPDGYVLVGDTQGEGTDINALVVKVNFNGTLQWIKSVGGKAADSPAYVTPAYGGGYLVAGFTFSWGAGNRDFWLFKISDSGQVEWSCTQGDAGFQEAYGVIQTSKNEYIMIGWTDPPGQPALIGKALYDFYIVKLSPRQDGNETSNLQVIVYVLIGICIMVTALLLIKLRNNKKKSAKEEDLKLLKID